MGEKDAYRLHDYKIIEYDGEVYQWERHTGFGVQQSGHCFIQREVLIIEIARQERIGYLIGEFFDSLKRLPVWTKTKYYCNEVDIISASRSGERVRFNSYEESYKNIHAGEFRLGNYLIVADSQNDISWITSKGRYAIMGGPCELCGNLLLLKPKAFEKSQSRKEFFMRLKSRPIWRFTDAYALPSALNVCSAESPHFQNNKAAATHDSILTDSPAEHKRIDRNNNDVSRDRFKPAPDAGASTDIKSQKDERKKRNYLSSIRQAALGTSAKIKQDSSRVASRTKAGPGHEKLDNSIYQKTLKLGLAGIVATLFVAIGIIIAIYHHELTDKEYLHRSHDRSHTDRHKDH